MPSPPTPDVGFLAKYRALEARMKNLAETDGHVFVPNPEPVGPVEYVAICMEPSFGKWARNLEDGRTKVKAGFRNFIASIETSILRFCIQQYLGVPPQRYHITDLSKGAMRVTQASVARRLARQLEEPKDLVRLEVRAALPAGEAERRQPVKRIVPEVAPFEMPRPAHDRMEAVAEVHIGLRRQGPRLDPGGEPRSPGLRWPPGTGDPSGTPRRRAGGARGPSSYTPSRCSAWLLSWTRTWTACTSHRSKTLPISVGWIST
jgi:hypothetical protein